MAFAEPRGHRWCPSTPLVTSSVSMLQQLKRILISAIRLSCAVQTTSASFRARRQPSRRLSATAKTRRRLLKRSSGASPACRSKEISAATLFLAPLESCLLVLPCSARPSCGFARGWMMPATAACSSSSVGTYGPKHRLRPGGGPAEPTSILTGCCGTGQEHQSSTDPIHSARALRCPSACPCRITDCFIGFVIS